MEQLSPNSLAFIALVNEYCGNLEHAPILERGTFVHNMAKLLPRIYISALDLPEPVVIDDVEIPPALDETQYDLVRSRLAAMLGEDDVYLEVFMDDMKYSDSPIATSISENLADLYQVFYDLLAAVRDLDATVQRELLVRCREDFDGYWSQKLCNVLRAVNNIMTATADDDDMLY